MLFRSKMGIELGKSSVREFSDGEIQVNIEESIRGHHVFILQMCIRDRVKLTGGPNQGTLKSAWMTCG